MKYLIRFFSGLQISPRLSAWVEEGGLTRDCNDLYTLSKQLGVSRKALSRYFLSQPEGSFYRWRQARRIEKAMKLLSTTDIPVAEIAAMVGIPDKSNFHKAFVAQTGMNPAAWRAKRLEKFSI